MAITEEIHEGDEGTYLWVTVSNSGIPVDLSAATTKEIFLCRPDNSVMVKTADFKTDGTDGILQYVSLATDFDQVGTWELQGHVAVDSGEWKSSVEEFEVHKNLA